MSTHTIRTAAMTATLTALLAGMPNAWSADEASHKLGDHPAVVVQRLTKAAGYDYASRFYPHPAWLYLHAKPPADDAVAAPVVAGTAERPAGAADAAPARAVAVPQTRTEIAAGG